MSLNVEQVKKTIRDLLNLAENDAATEGEINNAITFARRLMDAHHLEADDCVERPTEDSFDRQAVFGNSGNLVIWETNLTHFVEELVGSVNRYFTGKIEVTGIDRIRLGKPGLKNGIYFYGPAEDVQLATDIFHDLYATIMASSHLKYRSAARGEGREYATGFVKGLLFKLREAKQKDKDTDVASRALIVRSDLIVTEKKEKGKNWLMTDQKVKLRNATRQYSSIYKGNAYDEGVSDGKKVNPTIQRKAKLGHEPKKLN